MLLAGARLRPDAGPNHRAAFCAAGLWRPRVRPGLARTVPIPFGRRIRHPTQRVLQVLRAERLDQMQLETGFETAGLVGGISQAAHGNSMRRTASLGVKGLQQFPACAVRQGNIAQEQIESGSPGTGQRTRLVFGERRPVPQSLEKSVDSLPRVRMIFDDENVQRVGTMDRTGLAFIAFHAWWHQQINSTPAARPDGSISFCGLKMTPRPSGPRARRTVDGSGFCTLRGFPERNGLFRAWVRG